MTPDIVSLHDRFNDAARPSARARIAAFIDQILAIRPDLKGQEIFVPVNGRVATTVIIGDEVFKTTTDKRRLKELARELAILEIMSAHKVPFVPTLTYVSPDRGFFSMKKLPGVTLESLHKQMTDDDFARFAVSFGQARAAIDNALAGASLPGSKRFHNKKAFSSTARALRLWDKTYLQETLSACDEDIRAMLTGYHDRLAAGRKLFCHIDLNRGNILVDPVTKCVTGFIDLARANQTPFPEPEFEHLFMTIYDNHAFVAGMYAAYADAASAQGVAVHDIASYTALSTFGFWHEDSERRTPDIVKRAINNCIESLPRAMAWLPKPPKAS